MKHVMLLGVAVVWAGVAFALEAVAPTKGSVVPLLSEKQKVFMQMSHDERLVFFDDAQKAKEKEITTFGDRPLPVQLEWKGGTAPYRVDVTKQGASRPFFSESIPSNRVAVWNLEVAATYVWRVVGADGAMVESTFATEAQAPRLIYIPGQGKEFRGVPNMRDMGGRVMSDGRRVRQGLIFRSSGLNNNAVSTFYSRKELETMYADGTLAALRQTDPKAKELYGKLKAGKKVDWKHTRIIKKLPTKPGTPRLTEASRRYLTETLGIKTDIDLRSERERFGLSVSPLGPDVQFVHDWENYYDYARVHSIGLAATKTIFRLMMDRANYPIDFHCIGGADRTGTVATLLHGILGATDDDIWRDYQITAWHGGVNDARHLGWFASFVKSFDKFEGATLSARICDYFHKSCGFTEDDLNKIRSILLEDKQ